jgi:hypothetical protein
MTENTNYTDLREATASLGGIRLSPDDSLRFIAIVQALFGNPTGPVTVAESVPRKPRNAGGGKQVTFGRALSIVFKDAPRQGADLREPLLQLGVILPNDPAEAELAITQGIRRSGKTYRQYPDGSWGRRKGYQPLRSVG